MILIVSVSATPASLLFCLFFRIFATDQVRIHGVGYVSLTRRREHNGVYSCNVHTGAGDITSDDDFLLNVRGELRYVKATSFTLKFYDSLIETGI